MYDSTPEVTRPKFLDLYTSQTHEQLYRISLSLDRINEKLNAIQDTEVKKGQTLEECCAAPGDPSRLDYLEKLRGQVEFADTLASRAESLASKLNDLI